MNERPSTLSVHEHDSAASKRRKIFLPHKSSISEYLNTDAIQMIWEPIRELSARIENQRRALADDVRVSNNIRSMGMTQEIGVTKQEDLNQQIQREDSFRLADIQSMETAVLVLLEGLDSVSKGIRPSESFFDSLDDIEESAAREVQKMFTIENVSPTADSRIGLRATSNRLKAIQDFRQNCLSLKPEGELKS